MTRGLAGSLMLMMSIPDGTSRWAVYAYGRDSSCSSVMSAVFSIESIARCPRTLMLRLPPVLAPRITLVQGSCALVAPAVTHARTSERMASEPARLLMAGLLAEDGDARVPGSKG